MRSAIAVLMLAKAKAGTGLGSLKSLDLNGGAGATLMAVLEGSGAVSATIDVYGSHYQDQTKGVLIATLSPSGTGLAVDSANVNAPWPFVWINITAISGTGARATVTAGG